MKEVRLGRKAVEEFRRIAKADWGLDLPYAEAKKVAERFLANLANLPADARDGSAPPGERFVPGPPAECGLCRVVRRSEPVSNTEHGPLCAACAEAIVDGTLPAYVTTDRNKWCTTGDLCAHLKTTPARIAALVRHGRLVARTVRRTGFRIYLAEDQPKRKEDAK